VNSLKRKIITLLRGKSDFEYYNPWIESHVIEIGRNAHLKKLGYAATYKSIDALKHPNGIIVNFKTDRRTGEIISATAVPFRVNPAWRRHKA